MIHKYWFEKITNEEKKSNQQFCEKSVETSGINWELSIFGQTQKITLLLQKDLQNNFIH